MSAAAQPGRWMVTGHRDLPREHRTVEELRRVFARLVAEEGMTGLITGMARGADLAAVRAIETYDSTADGPDAEMFVRHRLAPFDAYVPFPSQVDRWRPSDRTLWWCALGRARHVKIIRAWSDDPWTSRFDVALKAKRFEWPTLEPGVPTRSDIVRTLHQRNDAMVADCVGAVAVWDGRRDTGGTASVVRKLIRADKPIVFVDPSGVKRTRIVRSHTVTASSSTAA